MTEFWFTNCQLSILASLYKIRHKYNLGIILRQELYKARVWKPPKKYVGHSTVQGLDIQGQNIEVSASSCNVMRNGAGFRCWTRCSAQRKRTKKSYEENDNLATTISHHFRLCIQLLHASWSFQRLYIFRNYTACKKNMTVNVWRIAVNEGNLYCSV